MMLISFNGFFSPLDIPCLDLFIINFVLIDSISNLNILLLIRYLYSMQSLKEIQRQEKHKKTHKLG